MNAKQNIQSLQSNTISHWLGAGLESALFLVLRLEYFWRTQSITWLLMSWLLTPLGHQQPWYLLCIISRPLSSIMANFHLPFEESTNNCSWHHVWQHRSGSTLAQPMFTYHQWGPVIIPWGPFYLKKPQPSITENQLRIYILGFCWTLPEVSEFIIPVQTAVPCVIEVSDLIVSCVHCPSPRYTV